jgi:hypothetical protein
MNISSKNKEKHQCKSSFMQTICNNKENLQILYLKKQYNTLMLSNIFKKVIIDPIQIDN